MTASGVSIVIVGGGLSGALCALHLLAVRSDLQVNIVERSDRLGPGLAYGACSDEHLLNVPVNRLSIKAPLSFEAWLIGRSDLGNQLEGPIAEAGGRLGDAFVPRRLFGVYLEEQVRPHLAAGRLSWKRGEAVAFLDPPQRGVLLSDGREIAADAVILALGNRPPRSPAPLAVGLEDLPRYIADPWAPQALANIAPDDAVLLVGTGLTMVDIALSLRGQGHTAEITALSRRGRVPGRHVFGGQWPAFLATLLPSSPADLVRLVRREVRKAEHAAVPWQRVIDSVRPFVARIWRGWSEAQKRSFLRHLRPAWDVVRHRMAPGIADKVGHLIVNDSLKVTAGRISGARQSGGDICVDVRIRDGREMALHARHVINCTGPRSDFAQLGMPLIVDARRRRLIRPDALGLGIETESCAAVSADGAVSDWLYAVGALTRSAWWEVTAAPEINAQILELAATLANPALSAAVLADRFVDLGAGI